MHSNNLNTYFNDFVFQQRSFYETVACLAYFRNDCSKFLNLGYKGTVPLTVQPEDKKDELPINLYLKTLEGVEMKNIQSALEIGCGRGGGCYVLKKYFNIPQVSGLDLTYFNLQNARRNTEGMQVEFIHRNIFEFTPAKRYDLVLSVDTCQTYQDFPAFLKKANLCMHSLSVLAYSDFAFAADLSAFSTMMDANGLEIIKWEDLTDAMCRSIGAEDPRNKKLPVWQRLLLGKKLQRYLVWSSSEIDALLNSGELRYIKLLARPKNI